MYGLGLAADSTVLASIYTLPDVPLSGKATYELQADAFPEPLKTHILILLTRLGLPTDHPVLTVNFEDGSMQSIYQPVMVAKDGQLCLKVCKTLLPITLDPVKGFVLAGKAITLKAGISTKQQPWLRATLIFKPAKNADPGHLFLKETVIFDFGGLFNQDLVREMISADPSGGNILNTVQGFVADYIPDEQRIDPPTEDAFAAAISLLYQWGGLQGNILKLGALNQILSTYEEPLSVGPLVFWVDGAKLQQPKPGTDYAPQLLIQGKFSEQNRSNFPELDNVSCLSFNQPSGNSNNRQAWVMLNHFLERGELAGSAIKVIKENNTENFAPAIAFFDRAKVKKIAVDYRTTPGIPNVLGFTSEQIALSAAPQKLTSSPALLAKVAEDYSNDGVDWQPSVKETLPKPESDPVESLEELAVMGEPTEDLAEAVKEAVGSPSWQTESAPIQDESSALDEIPF